MFCTGAALFSLVLARCSLSGVFQQRHLHQAPRLSAAVFRAAVGRRWRMALALGSGKTGGGGGACVLPALRAADVGRRKPPPSARVGPDMGPYGTVLRGDSAFVL